MRNRRHDRAAIRAPALPLLAASSCAKAEQSALGIWPALWSGGAAIFFLVLVGAALQLPGSMMKWGFDRCGGYHLIAASEVPRKGKMLRGYQER